MKRYTGHEEARYSLKNSLVHLLVVQVKFNTYLVLTNCASILKYIIYI